MLFFRAGQDFNMKEKNSKKYAYALFQLADEAGGLDAVASSLAELRVLSAGEAASFFKNPFVAESDKEKLASEISAGMPVPLVKLLFLLIQKREIGLLPEIERKYLGMVNGSRNVMVAEIVSAAPLERTAVEKIKSAVKKITGKEISVVERTDKNLIGGITVRAEDLIFDGSALGKLNSLKRESLNEI